MSETTEVRDQRPLALTAAIWHHRGHQPARHPVLDRPRALIEFGRTLQVAGPCTEQVFYDLPVHRTDTKELAAAMSTPEAAGTTAIADTPAVTEPEKPRRGRPKGSTARATRTIELTLTVTGTADGDWQAELKQGNTWLSRGLPVSASAVSKAVQELHAELAGPIDAVIDAAREQRAARVAALEAELEQARKALAEIE